MFKLAQMFHVKLTVALICLVTIQVSAQHSSTTIIENKGFPGMPAKVNAILDTLNYSAEFASLSKPQQEWFYWTNYSRKYPRKFWDSVVSPVLLNYPKLVSSYSKSLQRDLFNTSSLPFLLPNRKLLTLAESHSADLGKKSASPSHSSTDGTSFQERMKRAGVLECAGENISFGPDNTIFALVFLYIDERIPDVGHRKSLLNPAYTQMGIGTSAYPNGQWLIVQDFGCTQ